MITPLPIEFRYFVDKMGDKFESEDYSFDSASGLTTVNLCKTGYIMPCISVEINGIEYLVKKAVYNESFSVKAELTDPLLEIIVGPPKYFYGEVIATGAELSRIKNFKLKTPMVYLNTPTREVFNTDYDINTLKTVSPKVFLLHESNIRDWLESDHWDKVIAPVYYMADQLCEIIENEKRVDRLIRKDLIGYAKVGDLIPQGDPRRNLFAENYSGVSLDLEYSIRENLKCNCK